MTNIWSQSVHCKDKISLLEHKSLQPFSICHVKGY